jgi:hypothetical protein
MEAGISRGFCRGISYGPQYHNHQILATTKRTKKYRSQTSVFLSERREKAPLTGQVSLPTIPTMELFMYFPQMTICNVRVDLGCVDGGVAEELLYRADIGSVAKQIGSEDMSQGMRCNDARYARPCDIGLQVALDIARDNSVQFVWSAVHEQCFFHVVSCF